MIEKKIDEYIVNVLQTKCIDFVRFPNCTSMHSSRNYNTYAFGEPMQCHKYFPDFQIEGKGHVIWVENGVRVGNKLRHEKRKNMQRERINRWVKNSGVVGYIITSISDAKNMLKKEGIISESN